MKPDMAVIGRPGADEYAAYYEKYVSLVPTDDVLATLEKQPSELVSALSARKEADGDFPLCSGKVECEGIVGTCHRCRTRLQLPGAAHRPQRQDSAGRLRAG